MDETRNEDTFGKLPTLGRPIPDEKEPEGPARTWTDEDAERETMKRPVSPEEMTLAGRYKVLRRLGEGGMGSVWLAEDLKLDGRKVAIKMLPAVLAGKKGTYRQVKQEALMAMKLSHPNIATVRAFEEEDGNPFLVMDYIEGQGLDDILAEKGKLSEEETIRLLTPVAAALDYAHAQGVVHRDVKPGNVIVRKDGTPFVLDFGIAREIQETMTRVTGKFSSGTLLYMSPEQLRGRAPKVAQDVYSFAAMAYECLSDVPPFSRGQIEWQIVNEQPDPLEKDVAGKALREGIMAGLAKEPEKRPESCAGVLGNGGASRPGEPEKGTMANRTARPEGSPHHGTTEPQVGDEDVFLRKVRLGNELEAVEKRSDATSAEKEALKRIREVIAAGEEALKTGRDAKGEILYAEATRRLESWKRGVEERLEFEAEQQRRNVVAQRERGKDKAEQQLREKEARNEQEKAADGRWHEQATVGSTPKETKEEYRRRADEAEREKKMTEEGRHRREEATRKMQENEDWLRAVMMRRFWVQ